MKTLPLGAIFFVSILCLFYFRVFRHDGAWFALAKGGLLHRSMDGLTKFEPGQSVFPDGEARCQFDPPQRPAADRKSALRCSGGGRSAGLRSTVCPD